MEIDATGQTFAEALAGALNQVVERTGTPEETVAIPLRARESDLSAVVAAMFDELLAEIGEGTQVTSVQIDGFMKRDGEYICWGYAYAVQNRTAATGATYTVRDLRVIEESGRWEIRCSLDRARR